MTLVQTQTYDEILNGSIRQLRAGGKITNFETGGITMSLLEVMADQAARLHTAVRAANAMSYVDTAASHHLDLLAQSYGLSRTIPEAASVSASDRVIRFYTDDESPLVSHLPTGTIPVGAEITNSDGSLTFRVTEEAQFRQNDTYVYVSAAATVAGTDTNVGTNELTNHNLGPSQVLVTNEATIQNGTDTETDAQLRFRLLNQMRIDQTGNSAALRNAAGLLPGVADAVVRPHAFGLGTVEILLVPSGTTVPSEALTLARQQVDRVRSAGTEVFVRPPTYAPIQLSIRLSFAKGTTRVDRRGIKPNVLRAVVGYLQEIPLGGELVINELRQRVMGSSDQIRDMAITCFIVRKRVQILKNFRLHDDELFIPDNSVNTPIEIYEG